MAVGRKKHWVCLLDDLPPGTRKIVDIGGRSIGVFNSNGRLFALRNRCPHQGAPLCKGRLGGTVLPSSPGEHIYGREGLILRCPWHGWEFDITDGGFIVDPENMRVKTYDVTVETYEVTVEQQAVFVHV